MSSTKLESLLSLLDPANIKLNIGISYEYQLERTGKTLLTDDTGPLAFVLYLFCRLRLTSALLHDRRPQPTQNEVYLPLPGGPLLDIHGSSLRLTQRRSFFLKSTTYLIFMNADQFLYLLFSTVTKRPEWGYMTYIYCDVFQLTVLFGLILISSKAFKNNRCMFYRDSLLVLLSNPPSLRLWSHIPVLRAQQLELPLDQFWLVCVLFVSRLQQRFAHYVATQDLREN